MCHWGTVSHQKANASHSQLMYKIWRKVMAAYRRFYDSRHLHADCQEPGLAPEPYAR